CDGLSIDLAGTTITCHTPAHAAGSADIVVMNGDGQFATQANSFLFQAAPSITSLSPTHGSSAGGTSVMINGANFQQGATALVSGGASAGEVFFNSSTQLALTLAAHTPGTFDLGIKNPDGQSTTSTFTWDPPPSIVEVSPGSGPRNFATGCRAHGDNLSAATTVKLGGVAVSSTLAAPGYLIFTCPAQATEADALDLVLTNPDGQSATELGAFRYADPPAQLMVLSRSMRSQSRPALLGFNPLDQDVTAPLGRSLFAPPSETDQTGLANPTRALSINGYLYVFNATTNTLPSITIHERGEAGWDARGNLAPLVTIHTVDGHTFGTLGGFAYDSIANKVVVADSASATLYWIDTSASGDATSRRTLTTRAQGIGGIEFDPIRHELYVLQTGSALIDVYAESAHNQDAPLRTIHFLNGTDGDAGNPVTFTLAGDQLAVAYSGLIRLYPRTVATSTPAIQELETGGVQLSDLTGLAYDPYAHELFASSRTGNSVLVYSLFKGVATSTAARFLDGFDDPTGLTEINGPLGLLLDTHAAPCTTQPGFSGSGQTKFWFDAACAQTLRVSGGKVIPWKDRASDLFAFPSGAGFTFDDAHVNDSATNGLTAPFPVVQTASTTSAFSVTGIPASYFAATSTQDVALFAVFRNRLVASTSGPRTATNGSLFHYENGNLAAGADRLNIHAPWGDFFTYWDSGNAGTSRLVTQTYAPDDSAHSSGPTLGKAWNFMAFLRSGAHSEIRLNGTTLASSEGQSGAFDATFAGGLDFLNSFPGGLAELMVVSGPMSSNDVTNVQAYLSAKWAP
ncbi:MAG: IPT/TIG domain-containing protein, partial [Deltaproteobacteria bacterium]|nr:IPT/TIG domain-containing protein [Deltaproteobacteria bacterium]